MTTDRSDPARRPPTDPAMRQPTNSASRQPTKLQRWIDLVAFLAKHQFPVERAEIWKQIPAYSHGVDGSAQQKATVRRTFERDKDELRSLGVPIESVGRRMGFGAEEVVAYRLAPSYRLPVLQLLRAERPPKSDATKSPASLPEAVCHPGVALRFPLGRHEADAALRGLKELATLPAFPWVADARSAFRKLATDLEPAVPAGTPVLYAPDPEAVATTRPLETLSTALRRRKCVTFQYRGMSRPEETNRRVRPYGLLFEFGKWYLVGHDDDREDVRIFRVGRMSGLAANSRSPGTPDYAIPASFRLADHSGRKAWELGDRRAEPEEADVSFRVPRSSWAERNGLGELLERRPCGAQLRRFRVRNRDAFLRWVMSLLGEARIVSPQEMREECRAMARSVAGKYEGTAPTADGTAPTTDGTASVADGTASTADGARQQPARRQPTGASPIARSGGTTARSRFKRVAYIVAVASRPGGTEVAALARDLDTTDEQVLEDLRELTTRDEYRPGGWPGDIRIFMESGRVEVEHTSFMERPFRLTGREMFCLALALRGVMTEADDEPQPTADGRDEADSTAERRPPSTDDTAWDAFLRRAERSLSQSVDSEATPNFAVSNRAPDPQGIREALTTAVYERRPCAIRYLKPGAEAPSCRVVHPYLVVHSEATWYVVAKCTTVCAERLFRLDRILSLDHSDGTFATPQDFDAEEYLTRTPEGWILGPGSREAVVRYSPKVARWLEERAEYRSVSMKAHSDGSVTVRHNVADPHWLASHVLRFGVEAEVLAPHDLRNMVADMARKVAASQ